MNSCILSDSQKIAELTKDILDRDSKTFVKIRKDGRLGWESRISEDGAYSEFILNPDSDEELISNAYAMAKDLITVMDTPFKVNVRITPDRSCTDSDTVWVATQVFDDKDLPIGKKLDTFLGLAIHEGCHLLYTDFKQLQTIRNKIIGTLQNILEDERIERLCGEIRPGLANFLQASKYYYFEKYHDELVSQGKMEGLSPFQRLVNCILAMVRYPKALTDDDMIEFYEPLTKVRAQLVPYPQSTAEAIERSERIYEIIKDYVIDEYAADKASDGRESSDESDGSKQGKTSRASSKGPSSGKGTPGGSAESSSEENPEIDSKMEKEFSELEEALLNIVRNASRNSLDPSELSETVKAEGARVGQVCEGRLERGSQKDAYIRKAEEDAVAYKESLERVKRYVPAISRALTSYSQEYRLIHRGMRSGVLDTGKLVEAFQGVPTVYMREGQVNVQKIAVCILIDESGSMWGGGDVAARDTAILLNEALDSVRNVDLYIYGHTASGDTTELFVYRERGYSRRHTLGTTDSRWGNRDSVAIREAAARVRRFTKDDVLFFVISDGAPNESPSCVRKAVTDIGKDGFSTVAISIEPHYDPSLMYDRNVNLSDLSTLAIDLGKMVKKAIKDKSKRNIQ